MRTVHDSRRVWTRLSVRDGGASPRIVEAFGSTPAQAVAAGMMIGPAQVAARVIEGKRDELFT